MNKLAKLVLPFVASAALLASSPVRAQAYGAPISLDQAKAVMAAADKEARDNKWNVSIAIVDSGGHMVLFQRHEGGQFGSVRVALEKAAGAIGFKRETKVFQDNIEKGGVHLRLLNLTGDAGVLEGGVPIVSDGKLVGAIGVSGVTSAQDAQIGKAGAAAVK